MTYRELVEKQPDEKIDTDTDCVKEVVPNSTYPEWCGEDCDGEGCQKCWDREVEIERECRLAGGENEIKDSIFCYRSDNYVMKYDCKGNCESYSPMTDDDLLK